MYSRKAVMVLAYRIRTLCRYVMVSQQILLHNLMSLSCDDPLCACSFMPFLLYVSSSYITSLTLITFISLFYFSLLLHFPLPIQFYSILPPITPVMTYSSPLKHSSSPLLHLILFIINTATATDAL